MIHLTTNTECGCVFQDGAGVRCKVDRKVLERAECDAIICDDEHGKRATRTIPPSIERLVLQRAQYRCQVPGCRSTKHLSIHHIIFRSQGGTHDPSNLIVLCDGHHRVLHDGMLRITGRAPDELVFTRNGAQLLGAADSLALTARPAERARAVGAPHATRRHANPAQRSALSDSRVDRRSAAVKSGAQLAALEEDKAALAKAALTQLGFKTPVAARAVEIASARVDPDVELVALIKEALRHCH